MVVSDEHVAVVAHGLLNPMTAVAGGIEIALRTGQYPPEVRRALEAAKRQADFVTESLRELVLGLSPMVLAALNELGRPERSIDLT
jgi:signal transduction histidine kinase